jgi:hypothetical protein
MDGILLQCKHPIYYNLIRELLKHGEDEVGVGEASPPLNNVFIKMGGWKGHKIIFWVQWA